MPEPKDDRWIEGLVGRIDRQGRLLRTWALAGGVSAQMTAFEMVLVDGRTEKLIVRRHGDADRQQNPQIAADEFRLLKFLQSAGIPAPRPRYLDRCGDVADAAALVLEYVEGEPVLAAGDAGDLVLQMAAALAQIHRVDGSKVDLSFLPQCGRGYGERPARLDRSLDEGRIREALESFGPLPQGNQPVLLHGDFWPGNVLWREGRIAAVVDWEDAQRGDPLADVGNGRLEILWAFGGEAMRQFTERYRSMMGGVDLTTLPYWDLCAALRPASKLSTWGLDARTERAMREAHRRFVGQALDGLAQLRPGGY